MSVTLRCQINYKKPFDGIPKNKRVIISTTFYADVVFQKRRERKFFEGGAMKESWPKEVKKLFKQKVEVWHHQLFSEVMDNQGRLPVQYKIHTFILPELEKWIAEYSGKRMASAKAGVNYFRKYIGPKTQFSQIDEDWLQAFIDLMDNEGLSGMSVAIYWQKIREFLTEMNRTKICKYNVRDAKLEMPAKEIAEKDFLTMEEIKILGTSPCPDNRIKLSFLFCCYTGLDFGDMYSLIPEHIKDGYLVKNRNKTSRKDEKKRKRVVAEKVKSKPLHEMALKLISMAMPGPEGHIFDLPGREEIPSTKSYTLSQTERVRRRTYNRYIMILKEWVESAGITKKITSHCARHSFATNIEADEVTGYELTDHSVASAAGKRYRHALDERAKKALGSIPMVEISD